MKFSPNVNQIYLFGRQKNGESERRWRHKCRQGQSLCDVRHGILLMLLRRGMLCDHHHLQTSGFNSSKSAFDIKLQW
ncbi:hypothetical protein LWI28_028707 [Acer negundo]|uniref:Uncharacterized protein n=1 Tax=Acer negundo TaxID=4023 RepID=A0AAD5ITG6_ACENE|nr:hypothetical protein LWI28_028707 [Acer negundo]KAK4843191.1 hypothetical protein QYF36_005157 [Acer negundo]